MAKGQEELRATIPAGNAWHGEEVEARAKELGFNKTSDFILSAVNFFMNMDKSVYDRLQALGESLHLPAYMIVQNKLINLWAKEQAEAAVLGITQRIRPEFISVSDGKGYRTMTGDELFGHLYDLYKREAENKKQEIEGRKKAIQQAAE